MGGTTLKVPEVPVECPSCRQSVEPGAGFCQACGAVVDGGPDRPGGVPAGDGDGTAVATAAAPLDAAALDVRTEPAGRLVACPDCGAENSASRILCARCGVDLSSGEHPGATPSVHRPGPAEDVAGEVSTPRRPRSRTPMIVAGVIVLGAVVGLLAGTWLGQRGRDPEPTTPAFDPAVYPGEPEELGVDGAGASSTQEASDGVSYEVDNLVDGELSTAWSSDAATESAQDVDLALRLAEPAWVTSLTFANGAQADDDTFASSGRVLGMTLLADGDAIAELQLLDQTGLQRVRLPDPVLVDTVRLVVEAVVGEASQDVALSEVMVTGHPAVGEDLARMSSPATDDAAG